MIVSVQTPCALYVGARAHTVRLACRRVRERGERLGSVAALLARAGPNPWVQALEATPTSPP
jgi:hypothetical protein